MVNKVGRKRLFLVWSCLVSILPGMAQTEKLTDYVNPFVGTDGYGNVYPGAQIPFGGIQMSPDTDSRFYDAASGYKYNHLTLMGFSLTHLSGTGLPQAGTQNANAHLFQSSCCFQHLFTTFRTTRTGH